MTTSTLLPHGLAVAPLLAALALHFAIDLPAAAYQAGFLPLAPIEPGYALAAAWVLRRIHPRLRAALLGDAGAATLSPDGKEEIPTRAV